MFAEDRYPRCDSPKKQVVMVRCPSGKLLSFRVDTVYQEPTFRAEEVAHRDESPIHELENEPGEPSNMGTCMWCKSHVVAGDPCPAMKGEPA